MSKPDDEGWPWCATCKSYHHPDNPTCITHSGEEMKETLVLHQHINALESQTALLESQGRSLPRWRFLKRRRLLKAWWKASDKFYELLALAVPAAGATASARTYTQEEIDTIRRDRNEVHETNKWLDEQFQKAEAALKVSEAELHRAQDLLATKSEEFDRSQDRVEELETNRRFLIDVVDQWKAKAMKSAADYGEAQNVIRDLEASRDVYTRRLGECESELHQLKSESPNTHLREALVECKNVVGWFQRFAQTMSDKSAPKPVLITGIAFPETRSKLSELVATENRGKLTDAEVQRILGDPCGETIMGSKEQMIDAFKQRVGIVNACAPVSNFAYLFKPVEGEK